MNKKKRLVIVDRKRFTLCMSCIGLGLCIVISACIPMVVANANDTFEKSVIIYVKSGDTLWSIAKENNNSNKSTRKFVDEIMKYNGLSSADISSGQVIEIPYS